MYAFKDGIRLWISNRGWLTLYIVGLTESLEMQLEFAALVV